MRTRIALVVGLAALVIVVHRAPLRAQEAPPKPKVDRSTPEAAIRSFADAVTRGDVTGAASCVIGEPDPAALREWDSSWSSDDSLHPRVRVKDIKVTEAGTRASAVLTVQVLYLAGLSPTPEEKETVELRKRGDTWRIVPIEGRQFVQQLEKRERVPPLRQLATLIANPEFFLAEQEKNRTEYCRSNLKQLSVGLLLLVQKYNDRLALRADGFKAAVHPFTRNDELFLCPEHARTAPEAVSYSFNPHLENKDFYALKDPETLVFIYEGSKGKLDFRHSDRAAVAFVGGGVKLTDPAGAKKLRWKP